MLTGGSKRTAEFADQLGKPWIHIAKASTRTPETDLIQFVRENRIKALNVAGSRASKEPDLYSWVKWLLTDAFFWNHRGDPSILGGPGEG
jgi:hypothetical protein